ncbi:MAG: tRNA (N6-threonylcarbamoyladenosine(37)-N6)-methyltransferase TrmO [Colwellia sp.]|nr:tRNA (N6-threonylcarbamoyladenosine(37)-N6)-methyltransferase TrmO [Colwellia sp.]MCW8865058.1 tRNA (N6-threonylcarbamoyladenosine(37)-N6)-methyltransferase TrmO [Colwellia sp.]MCW9080269.1 tRNA (N6-threonylcarbamoyladenosine(37)-N6)-methyltransferase TrmO [Colwellia sp.]
MSKNNRVTLDYIGYIESPFKEKFAIPRQPGLVKAAQGKVILTGDSNNADIVKALEQFSHIWLLFIFHGTQAQGWKPLVRPPRLGGNKKMGVLATRSTFRPNPIGMSVVELTSVEVSNQQVILHISGIDLLDQTPIVDIKPYIPYSDALPNADAGFAQTQPDINVSVTFSHSAQLSLTKYEQEYTGLSQLIEQVLAQDPRPAYKRDKVDDKVYGMTLYDLNIEWQMQDLTSLQVTQITKPCANTSTGNNQ